MRLKESDVRERCAQRGYSWEEIQPCLRRYLGDGYYDVDVNHPAYPRDRARPPGVLQKAVNFTKSAAGHLVAGMPMCTEQEVAARFAICAGSDSTTKCEFFNGQSCDKCGCPISAEKRTISKLAWATQSCPVGKWGPVSRDEKTPPLQGHKHREAT